MGWGAQRTMVTGGPPHQSNARPASSSGSGSSSDGIGSDSWEQQQERKPQSPHSLTPIQLPSSPHLRGWDLRKVEGAGGERAKGQEAQRLPQP